MNKVYYISEAQYKTLIERKKEEKRVYNEICEELDKKKNQLTEGALLNEGIIDTIKNYLKKGALTVGIIASLLAAQKVDAQQLQQAGVPKAQIEQAMQKVKYNPSQMTTKQIEDRLIQIMKQNNLKGSLNDYNKLNPQQKQNILNGIKANIKSLDDVDQIAIGGWEKYDKTNAIKFDTQKVGEHEQIKATTVDTVATVPVMKSFERNSFKLSNPEQLKQELHNLIIGYHTIDSIVIQSSSSTLRNTGDAEGMTWKELSQKRGEEVAKLLIGENIDLGGEGVNIKGKITPEMVKINSDGQNGDGTSGPKSPYETDPQAVQSYKERGIDAKFWQSAAKETGDESTNYEQYQYVNIVIYGRVVEETTETVNTYNYRYVYMSVKKEGGKIDKGSDNRETDISKCTVKVKKTQKVKIPQGSVLQGMR